MGRRVSLYIAGMEADLGEGSLLLFNFTKEDLDSPAAVKNSYTQRVTLPATPANNRIFGAFFRSDRETRHGAEEDMSGPWFDPMRQTPFALYYGSGEVAASGYVKLESVARRGRSAVSYDVTLYGGLGSFIYALTYNAEGDMLTLADLDFLGTDDPAGELDFTITADAVREAWARLGGDSTKPAMWDVINFAPCYNGVPEGNFDPDRAVCKAADCGLRTQSGSYSAGADGLVLVDLPREFAEWQTKDLRSYLQRPAVNVRKIIEACCEPRNNGGYEVELDPAFFNGSNPYWAKAWMTLPALGDLELGQVVVDGQTYTGTSVTERSAVSVASIPGAGKGDYELAVRFIPALLGLQGATGDVYMHYLIYTTSPEGIPQPVFAANWFKITAEAVGADGQTVVDSASGTLGTFGESIGEITGVTPPDVVGEFGSDGLWKGDALELRLSGKDVARLRVTVEVEATPDTLPLLRVYGPTPDTGANPDSYLISSYFVEGDGEYSYTTADKVRSGVALTKADLLNTEHTPADYLLSYCKMFGLSIVKDRTAKKVSIMARKTFYTGEVVDMSERADLSDCSIVPTAAASRWYEFGAPPGDGQFASWYEQKYGRAYGLQRVNTGYGFNSDRTDVTEDIVFAGGATVQESSPCFADIRAGETLVPSVFVYQGATYDLRDSSGDSQEQEVPPIPADAETAWYGDTAQLDMFAKMQFHDSDASPVDGGGVLVFLAGFVSPPEGSAGYALTDDTDAMLSLNDGTPCWLLNAQVTDPALKAPALPQFTRVLPGEAPTLMDFGVPSEFAMPLDNAEQALGVYALHWRRFVTDRYDADTRVLTCRADLRGMDAGEELLRAFYAFDGALWVMNRVEDWSPETQEPARCEFIKVQDKDNYKA